jgi:hypothetical protein
LTSLVVVAALLHVPPQDFYRTEDNLGAGIEVSCALVPDSTWVDGAAAWLRIANTSDARWSRYFRYKALIAFYSPPRRVYLPNGDYYTRGPCRTAEVSLIIDDMPVTDATRTDDMLLAVGYERVTLEAKQEHVVEVRAPALQSVTSSDGVVYLAVAVFGAMEAGGEDHVILRLPLEDR